MAVLIISLPVVLAEEYSLLYDANGNLVYDQETDIYRGYNELNQLIRTRINNASGTILQEYVWDPIEERIFIKDEFYSNGSLKSSTYYFIMDYIVLQNSSGTFNRTNIYQDGVLIGYEDFDGKKRYVLPDHEGSAHIILNESGDVIEENLFSPFAEPLAGVKENKFSYEAKEYDSLVKDYDFHFRKYDPKLRIFTQPDTLIQNVYDPQSLNRYGFERNNPYKNTDPTGHQAVETGVAFFGVGFSSIFIPLIVGGIPGYIIGTKLREYYPPQQLTQDLSDIYDYEYAYAGPRDAITKLYQEMEDDLQKIDELGGARDLIDMLRSKLENDEEEEDKESTDGKKIKKDKLPDANDLIKEIKKEEDKDKNKGSPSSGSSGGGSNIICETTC